jgi:hypothetical protein
VIRVPGLRLPSGNNSDGAAAQTVPIQIRRKKVGYTASFVPSLVVSLHLKTYPHQGALRLSSCSCRIEPYFSVFTDRFC